jgi:hypothetical protein
MICGVVEALYHVVGFAWEENGERGVYVDQNTPL